MGINTYDLKRSVIDKAKISCENSGEVIHNHFVQVDEMVPIGSGAEGKRRKMRHKVHKSWLFKTSFSSVR